MYIENLFNDIEYRPALVNFLAGGETRSHIASIGLSYHPHIRTSVTLRAKFADFRSQYSLCKLGCEASSNGNAESVPNFSQRESYIMYANC